MAEDTMPLDGNAAAGRLGEIFTPDMTRATIACAGCFREGSLVTLRLYGDAGDHHGENDMGHITYRIVDHNGEWIVERADGHDRPDTYITG